jgi:hypothetical protein
MSERYSLMHDASPGSRVLVFVEKVSSANTWFRGYTSEVGRGTILH